MRAFIVALVFVGCGDSPTTGVLAQKNISQGGTSFVDLASGSSLLGASDIGGINQEGWLRIMPDPSGSVITGFRMGFGSEDVTWFAGAMYSMQNIDASNPVTIAHRSTGDGADGTNWISTYTGRDVELLPGEWITIVSDVTHDAEFNPTFHGWQEITDHRAPIVRAQTQPSRSIGTAWQPSTSKHTMVIASLTATCELTLVGGEAGHIDVLVGPTSSPTMVVGSVPCANTGTVVVGISSTVTTGGAVSYLVRPGDWVLVQTTNTTGTPSYTLSVVEETL